GAAEDAFATVSEESVRRLAGGRRITGAASGGRGPLLGGRYRVDRQLRPNSSVWLARDLDLGQPVVVKRHRRRDDGEFLRVARALSRLNHPCVARVLDFGITDEGPYTVLEHLDGVPLNALAAPNGYRLPGALLDTVARSLAGALTALHEAGVTHGAVGMPRVVLSPDGTVKLTQFDPGRTSHEADRADDLRRLGELLHQLGAPPTDLAAPDPQRRATALSDLTRGVPAMPRGPHQVYELLGPLRVASRMPDGNRRPVEIADPERQALLAMLLLRPGNVVTHAELDEGVRGREPSGPAPSGTGAHIARLRLDLNGIASLPEGYALHTSTDTVDIALCQTLVTAAEELREEGDLRAARDRVTVALALFRGTPLDGVPGPAARTARTRLTHLHLTLHRTAAELDLDLGEFARVATDLTALLHDHPAREDFRRLQMIALRELGRTAEALESYEEYEALGGRIDPALEELHRELLDTHRAPRVSPDRTCVTYDLADGSDVELLPLVAELIEAAGLTAREHALRPSPTGYEILLKTDRAMERLLEATVTRLPAALSELPAEVRVGGLPAGVHLTVTFWPDGEQHRAAHDTLRAELAAHAAASCVAVAPGLVDPYTVSALGLRGMSGSPIAYWYRMITAPGLDRQHR
ncbi:hypothetical protein G3I40_28055, partial [Streptomyces sp. SID14478]|uniref:BTAD domain-containing putative transcriptional regulator n=1 Tax=Streptomyces sp. SID14478 TaxID=2706073 RepID=UPI0014116A7B